mmetsp:Transcript_14139/g.45635  ORF Transcript_14139/g.45635 Transcript_14139/m.45635 type:complete len:201 (-) Transcript_14139:690-1292(-)
MLEAVAAQAAARQPVLDKVLDRVLYANVVRFALRLLSDMLLSTSVSLLGLTLRLSVEGSLDESAVQSPAGDPPAAWDEARGRLRDTPETPPRHFGDTLQGHSRDTSEALPRDASETLPRHPLRHSRDAPETSRRCPIVPRTRWRRHSDRSSTSCYETTGSTCVSSPTASSAPRTWASCARCLGWGPPSRDRRGWTRSASP